MKEGYSELTDIVSSYMDDFTGYNEELGGFDIVLCVKELMEQLDQLKASKEQVEQKLKKIETKCNETLELMNKDSGTNAYAGGRCTEAGQILQIIDEVE